MNELRLSVMYTLMRAGTVSDLQHTVNTQVLVEGINEHRNNILFDWTSVKYNDDDLELNVS